MAKKVVKSKIIKRPKNWENKILTKPIGRGLGSGAGNPRKIETPEKLWELFLEYSKWSKDNPYLIHQYTDRKGKDVNQKRQRALTYIGFEGWLCMNEVVYDLNHYERGEHIVDYRAIIAKIKKTCSLDTITGALAGAYNANLSARLEGLVDKTENKIEDNRKQVADLFPFKKK